MSEMDFGDTHTDSLLMLERKAEQAWERGSHDLAASLAQAAGAYAIAVAIEELRQALTLNA